MNLIEFLPQMVQGATAAVMGVVGLLIKRKLNSIDNSVADSMKAGFAEVKGEIKTLHGSIHALHVDHRELRERVAVVEHTINDSTPPAFRAEHKTLQ